MLIKGNPKKAITKCPFVTQFINYAQYPAVITLYSELLKAKDEEIVIFDYLVEQNLPSLVGEAIVKSTDINSDKIAGLYKLINVFSGYPILQQNFADDYYVKNLYLDKNPTSTYVLQFQWDSLAHLLNPKNLLYFVPLVPKAMEMISSIKDHFWQYHSACFDFLQHMSPCEEAHDALKGISHVIVYVLEHFQNHTIALSSVVNATLKIAQVPELGPSELMNILPVAAHFIKEKPSVIIFAWCFSLIRDVRQLTQQTLELVDALDPEVIDIVKATSVAFDKPYGGDLPNKQNFESLNDASPEQLFSLLKFLARRSSI